MGLFTRGKQSEKDSLRAQAENLVSAAQIQATAAYTSAGKRFDLIYSIPTDRWDSVLTVAGVFIAVTRANQIGLSEARQDSLMEIVAHRLGAWRSEGIATFEDCKAFFDRTFTALEKTPTYQRQPEFIASDALGAWIVWNLVEHAPESEQERGLVRALGGLITHSFFNWWSDEPAAYQHAPRGRARKRRARSNVHWRARRWAWTLAVCRSLCAPQTALTTAAVSSNTPLRALRRRS